MVRRGWFFIGRPSASANCIHVENVVDALVLRATPPQATGRVYNLSGWCTVEDFVSTIALLQGVRVPSLRVSEDLMRAFSLLLGRTRKVPLTEARVDALTSRAEYSIDRIRAELTSSHRLSIREGLSEMLSREKP